MKWTIKRSLKWLGVGLITTVAVVYLGAYFFMRSSLPPMDGQQTLSVLNQDVNVQRDRYGIPHIFAGSKLDALKALGYVTASERLFQMEMLRRLVHGELSEIVGPAALQSDKLYRSLMISRSVREMLENKRAQNNLDPQMWAELEAYFAGVNEYVQTHELPYEFTLLGFKPQPFKPEDAYAMIGYMSYSFGIATKSDVLMSRLAEKLSPELLQELRTTSLALPSQALLQSLEHLRPLGENLFAPVLDGSNAWLLSPQRTASGKSILANDPHIRYSLPGVWIEAHVQSPDFELYGHYLPLIPFAVIGHNRHMGWGLTMSMTDDMDLYQEDIDPQTYTYRFKDHSLALEVWQEKINIKGRTPYVFEMRRTLHGPVLDEVLAQKGLALKWAFHSKDNDAMMALHHMAKAQDMQSFKESLHYATAPGLNVMYADPENIGWWIFGEMAVKANPNSDFILNGSSGKDESLRLLSLDEKPHLENPASGVIVSANAQPEGLPVNIRGDWQSDNRYQSIHELLKQKQKWTSEELQEIQTANYNHQTQIFLEQLLENLELTDLELASFSDILTDLKSWNHHSETDSVAASVYHQWNNEVLNLLLKDWSEEDRSTYLSLPYAWRFYERVLPDANSPWWQIHPRKKTITEAFHNAISKLSELRGADSSDWSWGNLHTLTFSHPLGRNSLLSMIFNVGPYPIGGAYNEINNNKFPLNGGNFKVTAGPSTRRLIDFAHPEKSYGILPLGNSGHLLSPYYKDQRELFFRGEYRDQLMNKTDIEAQKTHDLTLKAPTK